MKQMHPIHPVADSSGTSDQGRSSTQDILPEQNEGLARVVEVGEALVWLEPMQQSACGSCASAESCAAKGLGTLASRRAARRFSVKGEASLTVGEVVLVDFGSQRLLGAAVLAYVLPLFCALLAAGVAQTVAGNDLVSLLAAILGLVIGFGLMRWAATRLLAGLTPRIVRRLGTSQDCQTGV